MNREFRNDFQSDRMKSSPLERAPAMRKGTKQEFNLSEAARRTI